MHLPRPPLHSVYQRPLQKFETEPNEQITAPNRVKLEYGQPGQPHASKTRSEASQLGPVGFVAMSVNARDALRRADAVCFDVDSTVVVDEGIDKLADVCGVGEEVANWCVLEPPSAFLFRR